MSITVKHQHLLDRSFLAACASLDQLRFPMPIAYNISRINKQLQKALKEAGEFYITVLKRHAQLDDKGEFVPRKNEEGAEADLEKDLQAFMDIDVEIKSFPLKVSELGEAMLTPETISKLDGVILFE